MPYDQSSDLPDSVRNSLPSAAQTIYRKAFNNAWQQYSRAEDRLDDASREETAHRVAWAAVKRSYRKENDRWVAKD